MAKGDKARVAAIDVEATAAVIRYLGARATHPGRERPQLWLGANGIALAPEGIAAVVERRAEAAGIGHVTAHELRHLYADDLKARGASDETLKALGGWTDSRTLERYGRARQRERSIGEYRRLMEKA
jgi:site-specific recombinase XerD